MNKINIRKQNTNKGSHRFANKRKNQLQGDIIRSNMRKAYTELDLDTNYDVKFDDLDPQGKKERIRKCLERKEGKGVGSRAKRRKREENLALEENCLVTIDPSENHRVELNDDGTFKRGSRFYYGIVRTDYGERVVVQLHTGEEVQVRKGLPWKKNKNHSKPRLKVADFVFVEDPFPKGGKAKYKFNQEDLKQLKAECPIFLKFDQKLRGLEEEDELNAESESEFESAFDSDSDSEIDIDDI